MRWLVLFVVAAFALSITGVALAQSPSLTATPSPTSSPTPAASPTSVATPAPQATPWPAPLNLQLKQSVGVTNSDGSFIPLDQRQASSELTWDALPGFTGTYVLERSRAAYGDSASRQWEAFAWVAGTWFVEEPYPFVESLSVERCYRVRTLINGELGPFSNQACTIRPPSTRPEQLATPGAPDTGNLGLASETAGHAPFVALGAMSLGLSLLFAGAAGWRNRQ